MWPFRFKPDCQSLPPEHVEPCGCFVRHEVEPGVARLDPPDTDGRVWHRADGVSAGTCGGHARQGLEYDYDGRWNFARRVQDFDLARYAVFVGGARLNPARLRMGLNGLIEARVGNTWVGMGSSDLTLVPLDLLAGDGEQ